MPSSFTIVVDVMGGDFGPRFCVPACIEFLRAHPQHKLILVGHQQNITAGLAAAGELKSRIDILPTTQEVEMGELAGVAFRHKRQSSMWRALELLAEGKADACVSGGNTGALMAMSRHLVKTIDGMSRPAICKPIPTITGASFLLDMGANLDCSPEQLLQFGIMGSALAGLSGVKKPSIALLNVGAETTKGNQEIKRAHALMSDQQELNFKGFIEGDAIFSGNVDVIVCDGFVGNVALKASEGAASFILDSLKREFSGGFFPRILGLLNRSLLKRWRARFDPSAYNGAALLGLKKVVVKSHGSASIAGFKMALENAAQQVEAKIPERLESSLMNLNI